MKSNLLVLFVLIISSASAQTPGLILDQNNVNCQLNNNVFFSDQDISVAQYEFPAGSGNHLIYAMAMWMGGNDINGQLKIAANKYGNEYDFFPGPVANDYNTTYYTDNFSESLWKVTKSQIENHQAMYTTPGYVPDAAITEWPGNGDVSEGVAAQLAPYVDVNGNQIYDPLNGDYPLIKGDAAVFVIYNDMAGLHTQTGGDPIGVEVHMMFYQINSADDLNNTTFVNVKLHNRGTQTLYDFHVGMFADMDIGNYNDDYFGSDSVRNMMYLYNGDSFDEVSSGQPGYGSDVPACGIKMLNMDAGSVSYFTNGAGPNGDPSSAPQYYSLLEGDATNPFQYSGDPATNEVDTEGYDGNPGGDRRGLISSEALLFSPGDQICIDYAVVIGSGQSDNILNISELYDAADFVQQYYEDNLNSCEELTMQVPQYNTEELIIYPNPSNGQLNIEYPGKFDASIYNLEGKIVAQYSSTNQLYFELESGMYIIEILTEQGISRHKVTVL